MASSCHSELPLFPQWEKSLLTDGCKANCPSPSCSSNERLTENNKALRKKSSNAPFRRTARSTTTWITCIALHWKKLVYWQIMDSLFQEVHIVRIKRKRNTYYIRKHVYWFVCAYLHYISIIFMITPCLLVDLTRCWQEHTKSAYKTWIIHRRARGVYSRQARQRKCCL